MIPPEFSVVVGLTLPPAIAIILIARHRPSRGALVDLAAVSVIVFVAALAWSRSWLIAAAITAWFATVSHAIDLIIPHSLCVAARVRSIAAAAIARLRASVR